MVKILDKRCCFTGHRDISNKAIEEIKYKLSDEIDKAIKEGYYNFKSGFANGVDIIAARIICERKKEFDNIVLEAYLPSPDKISNKKIKSLLECCDNIDITSQFYFKGCMIKRDEKMVDSSDLVIAVYDGRTTGGTFYTIQYAKKKGLEIRTIMI